MCYEVIFNFVDEVFYITLFLQATSFVSPKWVPQMGDHRLDYLKSDNDHSMMIFSIVCCDSLIASSLSLHKSKHIYILIVVIMN